MSDSIWSDGGRIQMPQYEKLTRIKKSRCHDCRRRIMWSSMCVFLKGGGSGMSAS